jgi:spermidine synthase
LSSASAPRPLRIAIHGLVAIGGVAALSWEVLWQIHAGLALGVSARGTAITLAATMGGMTVGSLAAGRWLRGRPLERPLRLYGLLELVVGLSGCLLRPGFRLLERIDSSLYPMAPDLASAWHAGGIALLLGPPSFAMGATVPVFARVARTHGTSLAGLYGINTLGAAVGVLLLAFHLVPAFGVLRSGFAVAGLNLAVCAGAWLLGGSPGRGELAAEAPADRAAPRLPAALAGLVSFSTGFVTFGLEVAWFRSLRAAFFSSTDSFAIILVAVLLPLGVGARLVPRLRRRDVRPGLLLALAGVAILLATPLVERMDLFAQASGGYAALLAERLALSLVILGPAMLILGMVLPWLLEEFRDTGRTGWLYGNNTLGAVTGSLCAAWLLLPSVGFARTAWLLGAAVVALALVVEPARRLSAAALGAAALGVAVTWTASVGRERVQGTASFGALRVLATDEGPDSTVSTVEGPDGARALMIDGFLATAEEMSSASYMAWMGRLPMLLHPDPRSALVICFGTGQTANAVREEGPQRLDVVELNPAVLGMAPLFVSNRGVLDDPRVSPIVMDGRAWLRRTRTRYDVVTLEPMPPHFAGVNALYSKEFYEIIRSRLEPGGIVAQWVPFHLLPPFHAASVAATFRDVFPDAILWRRGTGILLGRTRPDGDPLGSSWPGLERERLRPAESLQAGELVVLGPETLERWARLGRVITDDNQLLAYGDIHSRIRSLGSGRARANRRLIRRVLDGGTPDEPGEPPGD